MPAIFGSCSALSATALHSDVGLSSTCALHDLQSCALHLYISSALQGHDDSLKQWCELMSVAATSTFHAKQYKCV
jgi:hypothetical protein